VAVIAREAERHPVSRPQGLKPTEAAVRYEVQQDPVRLRLLTTDFLALDTAQSAATSHRNSGRPTAVQNHADQYHKAPHPALH
jgi:hypothetical protein